MSDGEAPDAGWDAKAGTGSPGTRARPARGAVTHPASFVTADLARVIYLEGKILKARKFFP